MITVEIKATTRERQAALKAATEAGDAAAIEANEAVVEEAQLPETVEEAVAAYGEDECIRMICAKKTIELQDELRQRIAPKSESAMMRAAMKKLLADKGMTLEELSAQLGIGSAS